MRIILTAALLVAFAALANAATPPPPGGGISTPGEVTLPWVKDKTTSAGGTTESGSNVDRNADTKQQDPCMVYTQDKGWRRKADCDSGKR